MRYAAYVSSFRDGVSTFCHISVTLETCRDGSEASVNDDQSIEWHRARGCDSGSCTEVAYADGAYLVRNSTDPDGPILRFTPDEWAVFAQGVRDGDFDFS
jgi:hypothetical protein